MKDTRHLTWLAAAFSVAIFFIAGCSGGSGGGVAQPGPLGGEDQTSSTADVNDLDSDGILNDKDNCPTESNPLQQDIDSDGIGSVCDGDETVPVDPNDLDADGIMSPLDNCPNFNNPDQLDANANGVGDVCEVVVSSADPKDSDADGILNEEDNCPKDYNQNQLDSDGDGTGDMCDDTPAPPEVKYSTTENFSLSHLAGFYTWYGNTTGLTTAEFLRKTGGDVFQMQSTGNVAELMTKLAYQTPLQDQPARTISPTIANFKKSDAGSFLYYTDSTGIKRVNFADNTTQNVALSSGMSTDILNEGFGPAIGSTTIDDFIITSESLPAFGLSGGSPIIAMGVMNILKAVTITETSIGPTSFVKNIMLGIQNPISLAQSGTSLYVASNKSIYRVNASKTPAEVFTIASGLSGVKSIQVINREKEGFDESSGLNAGDNLFVTYNNSIRHYGPNGDLYNTYAFSNAGSIYKPVLIKEEKAFLIPHGNKLSKLSIPIVSESLAAFAGGPSASGDFDRTWTEQNLPEYVRFEDCRSVTLDPDTKNIYAVSKNENVIRRIVHSDDATAPIEPSHYVKSEPFVGISDSIDPKTALQTQTIFNPEDLRYESVTGMLYMPASEELVKDKLLLVFGKAEAKIITLGNNDIFESASPVTFPNTVTSIVLDKDGNAYYTSDLRRNIQKISNAKAGILSGAAAPDGGQYSSELFFVTPDADVSKSGITPLLADLVIMGDHLYFSDISNHLIYRKKLDGTQPFEVFAGRFGVSGGMEPNVEYTQENIVLRSPSRLVALGGKVYFEMSDYIVESFVDESGMTKFKVIAGCGTTKYMDGVGTNACLSRSGNGGMHTLSENEIIFVEMSGQSVRRLNLETKVIDTIAGQPGKSAMVDGPSPKNLLGRPLSIRCAHDKNLCFVGESLNYGGVRILRREVKTTQEEL